MSAWSIVPVEPCVLGESPLWHPVSNRLYWCDIPSAALHEWDPRTQKHRRWVFDSDVSCCAAVMDGSLLLALRKGLLRFDPQTDARTLLIPAPYEPSQERFNDGKVDPLGRFWVGTIYEPRQPALAGLYRMSHREGTLHLDRQAAPDLTVSNGLAFSPDGRTIYRSDTTSHTIFRADYGLEEGVPGNWQVWARFERRQAQQPLSEYGGRPDGAAVDAQGCYWVAMYEGQRLLRLSPQGQCLQSLDLPVRCPTMPTFGGDDLRTLFVTTARQNRPAQELAEQPWAGCVLQMRVEVPGLPAHCVQL